MTDERAELLRWRLLSLFIKLGPWNSVRPDYPRVFRGFIIGEQLDIRVHLN